MERSGASVLSIDRVIVDAILASRIEAGTRLSEQSRVALSSTSRTMARETLIRLEARGIVQVIPPRGWYAIRPSSGAAQKVFQLRDLTARTALVSALSRSTLDATAPRDEHIVDAPTDGDPARAAEPMTAHIGDAEAGLTGAEDEGPPTGPRAALHLSPERS